MRNREGQFNYKESLEKKLPIGSGKIESTNRALVQARIKLPGAWWLPENAENIVHLRALRENGMWATFWGLQNEVVAERVA